MKVLPILSSSSELVKAVSDIAAMTSQSDTVKYRLRHIPDYHDSIDFLREGRPKLVLIDFTSGSINGFKILDLMFADRHISPHGIIAVCESRKTSKKLEAIPGANLIAIILESEIKDRLPPVLEIISKNHQLVFQTVISLNLSENISGSFRVFNERTELECCVNLVCNFLCNADLLTLENKYRLKVSLLELLLNAVEHGNCHINFDEKNAWLESGRAIEDLIHIKCLDPHVANKTVIFKYDINPTYSRFTITDEGSGFDWRRFLKPEIKESSLRLHGRGIMLTKRLMEDLSYNEVGNEVSFKIGNRSVPKN